ncbi:hypothetical protein CesoFtcFv8_024035 [Champsocephalus esox]|uniref:Uncharacterized protein n=1 Tax=Champsocephalus esox TaxID=159716 RepID=A0AAN8B4X8_9TELE|nr:hypothetical protein CesoFtcFv8_024035 [Champsocephalus esox]
MQERGSQKTGCLLFTVVQIDSVRPAFEAHDPGGLFSAAPFSPPSHSSSHSLGHPVPTNMPGIGSFLPRAVVSFLHQSRASPTMGTSAQANEQHLFLSSMAVHANHNTHFIWPLS